MLLGDTMIRYALYKKHHWLVAGRLLSAPNGAEEVPTMIHRLADAYEIVVTKVRDAIARTERNKDWGSNDLLAGDVLRRNELQVWFLSSISSTRRGEAPNNKHAMEVHGRTEQSSGRRPSSTASGLPPAGASTGSGSAFGELTEIG